MYLTCSEVIFSWEPWVPADGAGGGLNETRQYIQDFHNESENQGYPLNRSYDPGFEVIARSEFISAFFL